MARLLMVTWDGSGNLTPALGLARGLTERGHDVRLLGHRTIWERCERGAWHFRPFAHTAPLDASVSFASEEDETAFLVNELMMSPNVALDVLDELRAEPADALVADAMLLGALCAGEAERVPTVALFSTAFSLLRAGPFADALGGALGPVNAMRSDLGLPCVAGVPEVHDACALGLVASLAEFEPVEIFPRQVRFVGPFVDAPALMAGDREAGFPEGSEPRVLVSLSTGGQRQEGALQRLVDSLADLPAQILVTTGAAVDPGDVRAPANSRVVAYVPHERVLPEASLVVTHAGLGTVMKALAFGVPLLCVPMGRDQFFNAARVEALGAGVTLSADAEAGQIRDAVRRALEDRALRYNARHLAGVAATYGGASDAVALVEDLCGR